MTSSVSEKFRVGNYQSKKHHIFLLTGVFAVLELFMWKFGLFFPFCALFIFYIAVEFGNRWGFIAILSAVFVSGHFFSCAARSVSGNVYGRRLLCSMTADPGEIPASRRQKRGITDEKVIRESILWLDDESKRSRPISS